MTVLTSALETKMPSACCDCPDDLVNDDVNKQKTVWRYVKKVFLSQVFRSMRSKKTRKGDSEDERQSPSLRRTSFYLSTVSLEKRRPSEQSIDTIITLLDEPCHLDNALNEKIERKLSIIEGLV